MFEIVGQHKSGPPEPVGRRGGGELKFTRCIPLPYMTDTSHRQKLLCRVLKVLIVPFSQAAKYNCKSFEPRSHFKSSLRSVHNQWHYRLTDRRPILSNQVYNQRIIPSSDVIQLTLTLKMTTAQVVETSVTVNNNSPIQDYVHPDDQTQPTFEMTPGFNLSHW